MKKNKTVFIIIFAFIAIVVTGYIFLFPSHKSGDDEKLYKSQ